MPRTAIITGASQGIGRATALKFASHGYDLVLAARQPDRLDQIADEIRAMGRTVLAVSTDVRDAKQVEHLIQQAVANFGIIDVLINNAGIFALGPVEAFSLEDWQQIIDTNLWGYIHTIHALLPHFLSQNKGIIVNISSIGGIEPIPYQVPYTVSKYAVTGLTQSLRAELSPKGIHVCGIYPNFIRSRIIERTIFRDKDKQGADNRYNLVNRAIHSPILEKPEDVAKAIWNAVEHQRSDILVGSANLSQIVYRFFPGVMKALYRRVLGLQSF